MSVVVLSLCATGLVDGIWAIDCRDMGLAVRGLAPGSGILMRLERPPACGIGVCLEVVHPIAMLFV